MSILGIRSTKTITREIAEIMYKEFLVERMELRLSNLSNEELGDALDEVTTDIFSNYLVVDDQ